MKKYRVLVVGGSKGIGKAIADQLCEEGYEVVAPSHKELNLLSRESINCYITAHEVFNIIINNAGINDSNDIENVTDVVT